MPTAPNPFENEPVSSPNGVTSTVEMTLPAMSVRRLLLVMGS
jgi:hypothetical protein